MNGMFQFTAYFYDTDWQPIQGGVQLFLVALRYRNQEPLCSYADFIYPTYPPFSMSGIVVKQLLCLIKPFTVS